ncbi:hypothetical protein [Halopseudomonas sp.]|uniref:hypothetical protein n=1 Tax=Halopseudomonas sp. TaxID=2901191 RepID=UPI0039E423AD
MVNRILDNQGNNMRAIANRLGVSRHTVRLYLRDLTAVPSYPDRVTRATKLKT